MREKISRSTYEAYFGIVLAAMVGIFPMTWWLKFVLTFIVAVIAVDVAFRHPSTFQYHWAKRGGLALSGVLLVTAIFYIPIRKQYVADRAAALEGELCSFRSFWGTCYTPPVPIIEIGGDSGSKIIYVGAENSVDFGAFARNAGLRIERGKNGMEISTPVLDRSGKKIASIERNHWTVLPQPEIWDKNYTNNALEIKDRRGDVVLQLRYLPDRLQIAAEWRDQFGHGQEWAKCPGPDKRPTGCVIPWGDARTELQNEVPIDPIFQYPSGEHLGKFVDK